MSGIYINGLQKVQDGTVVLDIDDFSIQPGEVAAVVGAVGSGTAMFLDLLTGKARPSMGIVQVAELDPISERVTFSQRVGVLFAEDGLYRSRNLRQNLAFFCRLRGLPKETVGETLAQIGLSDQANVRVDKLASGLARRLAFGVATLHHPQVLILYDPFSRCDDATLELLGKLIRKYADDGVAVLILADDDANLKEVCDVIYALNRGRLIQQYDAQGEPQTAAMPFKIPIRLEGRVVLLNPAEIIYADAVEGKAYIHTLEGRLPTQFTLQELEERLSRSGFFRAHRSYLVNLQHVREVIPYTRNSFSLLLDIEQRLEIPLSRSAAGELRDLLGY